MNNRTLLALISLYSYILNIIELMFDRFLLRFDLIFWDEIDKMELFGTSFYFLSVLGFEYDWLSNCQVSRHGSSSSSSLLLLARPTWFYIATIYIRLAGYMLPIYSYLSWVSYPSCNNKIFPILTSIRFTEQQSFCKPRHIKRFETIFSNTFFLRRLMFL